jgi:hypothetical protein
MTMMNMLRTCSRTSASRIFSPLQQNIRHLSSSDIDVPAPLFIWLGGESAGGTNKLLLPVSAPTEPTATSPDDVLTSVNQHYATESQFVGGMGESDPGVWFATTSTCDKDTLEFYQLVQESIALVKQERHGVPFSLYTTGIVSPGLDIPLTELGLDCLQVSLFAGSPPEYKKATGQDAAAFGQVCGFIADASEQGIAVEVGVLSAYASSARDLARSLGARHVHVYDK